MSSPKLLLHPVSFLFILAAAAVAKTGIAQDGAQKAPPLLPPVNDVAIRASFEKKVTALMEDGKTADVAELLKGLQSKKVPDGTAFASPGEPQFLPESELYRRARKATLIFGRVYQCDRCDRWHGSNAGAVLIHPSGIAVTNYHVMDHKDSGAFAGMDSDGNVYPVAEILAASKRDDLAIVRLVKSENGADFPYMPLSTGDPIGTDVLVISHPDGRYYTLSEGIIARYFIDPKARTNRVQITADYAKGSSGSGVFNERGELTGVVAATSSIYYDQQKGVQKNLQMVVKSCIPVQSVRALFGK
ncbi:MAG: trypsin-like peptidase domain-containing protein [Verrucomicrobiales bacterium]|nr:trypsin-like peptidase domain-containing protein [Verrucomicrobiales bacterium]